MKITDVRIRKITDDEKMKAVVSITIDNEFVVHDIKIINGSNGEFIAMPNKRLGNGDFRDIAHPLTAKTREKICDAIFEEYHRVLRISPGVGGTGIGSSIRRIPLAGR